MQLAGPSSTAHAARANTPIPVALCLQARISRRVQKEAAPSGTWPALLFGPFVRQPTFPTMTTPRVISSRIKENWISLTCSACKTEVEYFPASAPAGGEPFAVACAKCGDHNTVNQAKAKAKAAGKRRIGTGKLCRLEEIR